MAVGGIRGQRRHCDVRPGEPFYATPGKGKNEVRIAYVLKQADLERAMDLLAKGIEAYNKRS